MEFKIMLPSYTQIKTVHIAGHTHKSLPATSCFVFLKLIFTVECFLTVVAFDTDGGYWWALIPAGIQERGEAERLTELPGCCLRRSGVAGVEFRFLWDFPTWIFKPFSDLNVLSHWSHLKTFSSDGALSFFLRSSSLLLASRLRVDGVFLSDPGVPGVRSMGPVLWNWV